jgi:hypothetical protein
MPDPRYSSRCRRFNLPRRAFMRMRAVTTSPTSPTRSSAGTCGLRRCCCRSPPRSTFTPCAPKCPRPPLTPRLSLGIRRRRVARSPQLSGCPIHTRSSRMGGGGSLRSTGARFRFHPLAPPFSAIISQASVAYRFPVPIATTLVNKSTFHWTHVPISGQSLAQ